MIEPRSDLARVRGQTLAGDGDLSALHLAAKPIELADTREVLGDGRRGLSHR